MGGVTAAKEPFWCALVVGPCAHTPQNEEALE